MKRPIHSVIAAGVAWMSLVSILRADPPASIEIIGVKLTDKNQVTVKTEVRNLLNENIQIDPNITFRIANLKGEYYDNRQEDPIKPDIYMARLVLYDDLTTALPNGAAVFLKLNIRASSNGLSPPLV